jgi:IS30 family transposase
LPVFIKIKVLVFFIARKDVIDAIYKLNSRPRKCLDYATPYKAFMKLTGIDVTLVVKSIRL